MLLPFLLLACATPDAKAGLDPDGNSPVVRLAVSPATAAVDTDAVLQYAISAVHADSSVSTPPVNWSAGGGEISSSGLFSAGSTPGTYTVTATLSDGALSGSASVTVSIPLSPVIGVSISPANASLSTGGTRQFLATATRQDGSTFVPSVTWSATGGTISSGGLYTAGANPGTYQVVASLGGGLADTSVVTLSAPVLQAVVLTPATASLYTGGTRQFTVSGQWSNGATTAPAVTYTATGGTITSGGLYTAGSTAGTYRVIATQQGGGLADTSAVTLSVAPPNAMYFNSSEPGGDGSNPNFLLADDFEDGDWYGKDCDQAEASGGLLQTDGWCGTIYANPITPAGAISPQGAGFRGSSYAANGGYHTGSEGGRNMAMHFFAGEVNLNEAYFRLYFQPQADYVGGHEKMFDFIRGAESGQMVALCYNYFGSQTIRCIPYLHQDDGIQGQSAWMGSNMAATVTMVPTHWYYIEMHVRLNTPGAYDGLFEWWMNDCGVSGTGCTGTPTLRGRYTTVKYRDAGAESGVQLGGIWIENWANPGTRGTMFYDNVIASRSFIGFAP